MEAAKPANSQLRLRVFAGPNGSGKSTIIQSVRGFESAGKPLDFCIYINADDIAKDLKNRSFNFKSYEIAPTESDLYAFAETSGLLNENFTLDILKASITFQDNAIQLQQTRMLDYVAQLLARFLREELLKAKKRFSFETVFSHKSNLDIMKRAAELGYKIYLYFVSTENPLINEYRVALRKAKDGHDVPKDKIHQRYYKSLDLLYDASKITYQAYFFDNSENGKPFRLLAHFKRTESGLQWEDIDDPASSAWFKKYYKDKATADEGRS
jgi:predicted ABC-type ATPase